MNTKEKYPYLYLHVAVSIYASKTYKNNQCFQNQQAKKFFVDCYHIEQIT